MRHRYGESARILVIDDDPLFRALIERVAERRGLRVTLCSSLSDVQPQRVPRIFDAIIVDFYLDGMKKNLNGAEVAVALEATPVLLISHSAEAVETNDPWPQNVRKFLTKRVGPESILEQASRLAVHRPALSNRPGGESWNR